MLRLDPSATSAVDMEIGRTTNNRWTFSSACVRSACRRGQATESRRIKIMAGAPESGDRTIHKKNAPDIPPLSYFPTQGEFQTLQQNMQTTMSEQKSVFHDGIIP